MNFRLLIYIMIALVVFSISTVISDQITPVRMPECGGGEVTLFRLNMLCLSDNGPAWIFQIFLLVILTYIIAIPIAVAAACVKNFQELREQQLTQDNNDSPTILQITFLGWLALMIFGVPFTLIGNYLANLAWRTSLSFLLGIALSAILIRVFVGLKTWAEYEANISLAGTNSLALWTFTGFVIAGIIM
jgi:hypothetical protein